MKSYGIVALTRVRSNGRFLRRMRILYTESRRPTVSGTVKEILCLLSICLRRATVIT
mgnify:CR=1 FL=1